MSPSCLSARRVAGLLALIIFITTSVAGPWAAPAERPTIVRGVAWHSDNSPIPNAKVRLRSLETARISSNTETTESGQFLFEDVGRGSYVVELVTDGGRVLAVSHSFRIEPGETVATSVRLSSRQPWFVGMFSNSAAAVIAAASSVGLAAIGSHAPPVSPQ